MPHVTPLVAPNRLSYGYHTSGQTHKMQVLCHADNQIIGVPHNFLKNGGGTILVATAAAALAAEFAAQLLTTDVVDTWTLESYQSGAYIPIETGTLGTAGSQTAAGTPYSRVTGFYRDTAFNPVKVVEVCATYFVPVHESPAALPAPFSTFWLSFVTNSAGRAGEWVRGRSDAFLASATNITGSLDRKSRRRAGLI